jgi:hypothetical protein
MQVLQVFDTFQKAVKPARASPCDALLGAAGLHGPILQENYIKDIQQAVADLLILGQVQGAELATIREATSGGHIKATAMNVLMVPELLYVPECLGRLLSEGLQIDHVQATSLLLKVAMVSSHKLHLRFSEPWDTDRSRHKQVTFATPVPQ